jgi:cytochrome c biogenesis protein CcmG, thiol:disulfide interchange protein DsbE
MVSPVPIAVGIVVVALVALLVYGVTNQGPSRTLDSKVAQGLKPAAPQLSLTELRDGAPASLGQFKGKVVLLNVWASWCTPCKTESPLLERWHRRMQAGGGTVLGIDTLDVKSDALSFIREHDLTYPQLNDRDGTSIKKLGTSQYPESFVIDRSGRITAIMRGPVDDAWMRSHVQPLLRAT